MTAEELFNDLEMDSDWSTYLTIGFSSLNEGDILIMQDIISETEYNSEVDATNIVFSFVSGDGTGYQRFWFEGDITNTYAVEDEVKITVNIKHVSFSIEPMNYDLEIFAEQWVSVEYYSSNLGTTLSGFKAMSQSTIVKV